MLKGLTNAGQCSASSFIAKSLSEKVFFKSSIKYSDNIFGVSVIFTYIFEWKLPFKSKVEWGTFDSCVIIIGLTFDKTLIVIFSPAFCEIMSLNRHSVSEEWTKCQSSISK